MGKFLGGHIPLTPSESECSTEEEVDHTRIHFPTNNNVSQGIIIGCSSVLSRVIRMQRSLAEVCSEIADETTQISRRHSGTLQRQVCSEVADETTQISRRHSGTLKRQVHSNPSVATATTLEHLTKGLPFKAVDDGPHDNRTAYKRFFPALVDAADRIDRLLSSIDTPSR
ncbi:unnamed protein product [Ascophyllum nodosum]